MDYKFFRKETGQWENVPPELWRWEVSYSDGVALKQFGDDGIFHQFQEIDQSQLALFKMVRAGDGFSYSLVFDPKHMKLIHFYRHAILNAGTPQEIRTKRYCFGYETKIRGITHKVILVIMPNGELVIS